MDFSIQILPGLPATKQFSYYFWKQCSPYNQIRTCSGYDDPKKLVFFGKNISNSHPNRCGFGLQPEPMMSIHDSVTSTGMTHKTSQNNICTVENASVTNTKVQDNPTAKKICDWLVVFPYPSEKWWSSSVGMMTFHSQLFLESHSHSKFHGSSHHQPGDDCLPITIGFLAMAFMAFMAFMARPGWRQTATNRKHDFWLVTVMAIYQL